MYLKSPGYPNHQFRHARPIRSRTCHVWCVKPNFSQLRAESAGVDCSPKSPPPSGTSESELVKALSLSLAGIQNLARIPETLDRFLERLSQPSATDCIPSGSKRPTASLPRTQKEVEGLIQAVLYLTLKILCLRLNPPRISLKDKRSAHLFFQLMNSSTR